MLVDINPVQRINGNGIISGDKCTVSIVIIINIAR